MDSFEIAGYSLIGLVAVVWLLLIVFGAIMAFPFGLVGLAVLLGVGILLIKVIKERLANKEDDYYAKNVEK